MGAEGKRGSGDAGVTKAMAPDVAPDEVPGVARDCGERRQEPQFRTAVQDNSARRTAATE